MVATTAVAAAAWAAPAPALAHDETISSSAVTIAERTVVWDVDVGVEGLSRLPQLAALAAPALDEARLQSLALPIARYLASGAAVEAGGRPLALEVGPTLPRYEPSPAGEPQLARVVQRLTFRSPEPIDAAVLRVAFFSDLTSIHRALLLVTWAGESRPFVRVGPSRLSLAGGRLFPTRAALAWDFFRWGASHIFIGYDHIAFLACLILAARGARDLLKVVTAFTIAHSVTLLLAALDVVRVPLRLVEIGIAASVVYVAVENIARGDRPARHRWWIAFALGLVHGLGLAGDLRDRLLADAAGHLVLAVVGFNLGVEVGQLIAGAALFLLLVRLRRSLQRPRRPGAGDARPPAALPLVRVGSLPPLLLGLYWLIARIAG